MRAHELKQSREGHVRDAASVSSFPPPPAPQRSHVSQVPDDEVSKEQGLIAHSSILGYSHFSGGFAGGQAEYVRVPYGDVNLLPIPASVPDEKALYLSDVLATSWHCVVDTGVRPGDVVAVWGAGPIGQMAAAFARHRGRRELAAGVRRDEASQDRDAGL